ncbi:cell division protein FtsQ/DivIB [Hyunsoonleella flava]|nr:cell division protein FtsQ/DivIB [Hyunsoonleella flava]
MLVLFISVGLLYAFASVKNNVRKISKTNISFLGENSLFITHEAVSKLLIQNQGGLKNKPKETLDLNTLEKTLNSNPMIKSAEVYVAVNGTLNAEIEQKRPVARVSTNASYYIDDEGKYMPLSSNYTARVPLVTGYVEKNNLKNVFEIAKKVEADAFLKQHVVEIHQSVNGAIALKLRQCKFTVNLGSLKLLDKKINNLKAFYKKSLKEKTLDKYSKVNLQFDNQVVCTKT